MSSSVVMLTSLTGAISPRMTLARSSGFLGCLRFEWRDRNCCLYPSAAHGAGQGWLSHADDSHSS